MYLGNVLDLQSDLDTEHVVSSKPKDFYTVAGMLRRFCLLADVPCDLVYLLIQYVFNTETEYWDAQCTAVRSITNYMFEMKHGVQIEYFDSPERVQISSVCEYVSDKRDGMSFSVYEFVHRHLSIPVMMCGKSYYKNDQLHGIHKVWCMSGNLNTGYKPETVYYSGEYRCDVPIGLHSVYVMFSTTLYETREHDQLGHTITVCQYSRQNRLISKLTYDSSNREITHRESYHQNGMLACKYSLKNNKFIGEYHTLIGTVLSF